MNLEMQAHSLLQSLQASQGRAVMTEATFVQHTNGSLVIAEKEFDCAYGLALDSGSAYRAAAALLGSQHCQRQMGGLDAAAWTLTKAILQVQDQAAPQLKRRILEAVIKVLSWQGRLPQAKKLSEACLEYFSGIDQAEFHFSLVRIAIWQEEPEAAGHHLRALEFCPMGQGEGRLRSGVVENLHGLSALAFEGYASALKYFEAALQSKEPSGKDIFGRIELHLWVAEAYFGLEQFDRSFDEAQLGLQKIAGCERTLLKGHLLHMRARAAIEIGRPKECVQLSAEAVVELRRVGDRQELAKVLVHRAQLLLPTADLALSDAVEAESIFLAMGLPKWSRRAQRARLKAEVSLRICQREEYIEEEPETSSQMDGIIAGSPSTRALLAMANKIARRTDTVLILGETGTGKEIVAQYVHRCSRRAAEPFVAVNCAAIPESLFESELFGHLKGSFTGAHADKEGLVSRANGGTLFLDEIGEMPLLLQAKILRLIQEGSYRPVGSSKELQADIRIISATHRDLKDLSNREPAGFRRDLFYRLCYLVLRIEALRDRPEDLTALARFFLAREGRRDQQIYWLDRPAWALLRGHHWPGNIRELEGAICGAVAQVDNDGRIGSADLPETVRLAALDATTAPSDALHLLRNVEKTERRVILRALKASAGKKAEAARALGIGRNTLYEKLKRHGLRPE